MLFVVDHSAVTIPVCQILPQYTRTQNKNTQHTLKKNDLL